MLWIRAVFLIAIVVFTPGYRWRCWIFCTDQTAIQNDYVEQRDRCREFAQLKLDLGGPTDEQSHKTQLVNLFSECMAQNGWTVPDGKGESKAAAAGAAAGAATAETAAATVAAANAAENKASLSRTAECDFARQNASISRISATRARACDLECSQRLTAAPGAPRPAACPSEVSPNLAHGNERD